MAAVNYYLGLARGQSGNPGNVVAGVASNGAASDVELRIQINNGTNATGITKQDVSNLLDVLKDYMVSNYIPAGSPGADLPAL